jgi:type IV pilus assembly protein PilB
MAVLTPRVHLSGLARRLVQDGLLAEQDAVQAAEEALRSKTPFVAYLVSRQLASAQEVAHIASQEFGVPLVDVDAVEVEPEVTRLVDGKLITKHHALPIFRRGNRLFLAVSDPTNVQALDEIKFHAGMTTESILVEEDKLARTIERTLEAADASLHDLTEGDDYGDLEGLEVGDDRREDDLTTSEIDDAPVVKFVNKIMLDAIRRGASDIHFEPYEKYYRVRLRMDGVLREVTKPPIQLAAKIAARIKVMARLDVSERRVPQDGRIKLRLSRNKAIDFRISTCPTLWGEKVVMRILDPSSAFLGIDMLGYEEDQRAIFLEQIMKPYGMFLVTGPTGSGKTVSLYTGVGILNTADRNISTAEDPVEINLAGVNQVQVDEKTGMTFAKALKAFLRQDPDVILVGEIRDLETGSIAVKAAQTGHLVLSTLHTNDAPQTLNRLVDMGIQPFAVATAVNIIIAQRLARRLCSHCKAPAEVPPEALLAEGFTEQDVQSGMTVYRAVGCDKCNDGYKGRVGIYQVMPISDEMRRLIMEGRNAIDLADQAQREGIRDIRQSALLKVRNGVTSLEEINRVTLE